MPEFIKRDLQWKAGYKPGVCPWNNGGGLVDMQNIEPLPDNSGFRALRGARRTGSAASTSYNGADGSGIYTLDPAIYNVAVGTALTASVSDGNSREVVVAPFVHKGEAGKDTTTLAAPQALRRVKANQFGKWVSLHGNSYYFDAENPVYGFDGERVRLMGIRPPRTRPYIKCDTTSTQLIDAMETGWAGASAYTDDGAHVTSDFMEGTGSFKVTWDTPFDGSTQVSLASKSGLSITCTASENRGRMWVKCTKFLPTGTLEVSANAGALTAATINQDIPPNVWHSIEFDASAWAGQTITAINIRVSIDAGFNVAFSAVPATFWFDGLTVIDPSAGDHTDTYQTCYTFYDSKRDRESNPSPPSTVFICPSVGCKLVVDRNAEAVEDNTNVDKCRVYLRNINLDADKWFLVQESAIANTYTLNLGDEETVRFEQGVRPNWPGEPPVPGAQAVVWGDRIFSAVTMDDYSTGTVTATAGSDTFTGSGTSWRRFMEGMQIRLTSSGGTVDEYTYTIVRVVSTTSLRISRTFTAYGVSASKDGLGYEGGATGGSATFVISAPNDVIRYSAKYIDANSGLVESDSEAFSTAKFSVRPNDGDRVVGIGLTGRDLMIFKRNSCYVATQNFGEPDGFGPVVNDPELVSSTLGCRARRSIVQDRTGGCVWWASNKAIVRYAGGSIETLVPAEYMASALRTAAASETETTMADSFGAYDPESDCYYLWIYPGANPDQSNLENCTLALGMVFFVYDFRHRQVRRGICNGIHPRSAEVIADDDGVSSIYVGDDFQGVWRWGRDETYSSWGLQNHVVQGSATSSTNNTVTTTFVNIANNTLNGLYLKKISGTDPTSSETRRIASNTESGGVVVITVSPNWTVNPVSGDVILIGAVECSMDFMQHYAPDGMSPIDVRIDCKHGTWSDDLMEVRAYSAASTAQSRRFAAVNSTGLRVTRYINTAELEQIGPTAFGPGLWGRPWQYRLRFWAVDPDFEVYNVAVTEQVEGASPP